MLLACTALLLTSGCDKYARHKVLTFFFTGVPPVDGEVIANNGDGAKNPAKKSSSPVNQEPPSYAHGPFASGQCHQCHATAGSATFRGSVRKQSGTSGRDMGGVSARLLLPIKDLCIDCHSGKSVKAAFGEGLWVHGPVSEGICTVCHNPHQSPYRFMLLKGNTRDMCTTCHTKGFIVETEDHLSDKDCTECHNPHVGKNRYLLKKDMSEAF